VIPLGLTISATTTLEQFDKLYTYAIKDDSHNVLILDLTKSKVVFKSDLDTLLELKISVVNKHEKQLIPRGLSNSYRGDWFLSG